MAADANVSKNEEWATRGAKALLGNYRPMPIALVGGEGARVIGADGNRSIDFVSGIAVSGIGETCAYHLTAPGLFF